MCRSAAAAYQAFEGAELVGDAEAGPIVGASAVQYAVRGIGCLDYEPDDSH